MFDLGERCQFLVMTVFALFCSSCCWTKVFFFYWPSRRQSVVFALRTNSAVSCLHESTRDGCIEISIHFVSLFPMLFRLQFFRRRLYGWTRWVIKVDADFLDWLLMGLIFEIERFWIWNWRMELRKILFWNLMFPNFGTFQIQAKKNENCWILKLKILYAKFFKI